MKQTLILISIFFFSLTTSCARQELTQEEALEFLYKYMPLPDKIDYDTAFYRRNIAATFLAREEMPWGKSVPVREFKHFVLPVRVNNENMDESRMVFYEELHDRVKDLSMKEAILEVNHWCHEKVTYTPSDERTSAPLATVKTAYGRCGEESTFCVAALRSVGIPARQVYTPRWAHTDDNHAWVEAWADGEWFFMGACEPEAVLNLGWFNAPASRGMLMHTKAFGDYDGPEEVISRTACYTEINVTKTYAPTRTAYVKVVDENGKAVEGASVEFKIYNYAEFYTVSRKETDTDGLASIEAGLGDLLAWGSIGLGSNYGFAKVSVAKGDTAVLVLDKKPGERYSADIDIVPPVERNTVPELSPEQVAENARRLAYEDSLRNAYIVTFDTSTPLLAKTRGNHSEIKEFLERGGNPDAAEKLLGVISDKDLRDISCLTLRDFYENTPQNDALSSYAYFKYVMNPRVANEMIRPHRAFFNDVLTPQQKEDFRADPRNLIAWINDNIEIDTEHNPQNLRMTPGGVWDSRRADVFSIGIFFVSVCRSLGLPARIDPVTQKVQYGDLKKVSNWKHYAKLDDIYCEVNIWKDVQFGTSEQENAGKGLIAMSLPSDLKKNPEQLAYYTHYTLSAIKNGSLSLLNMENEHPFLQGKPFKSGEKPKEKEWEHLGLWVDSSDYLLVTGTRLANGSVLAHLEIFPVEGLSEDYVKVEEEEKVAKVPLILRHDDEQLQVIGSFNSENLYKDEKDGVKSVLSTSGRGYFIVGMIAPNNEPTNHVLRDIALYKKELEAWGRTILLVFRNQSEADRFRLSDFPELPSNVVFGVDETGAIAAEMPGTLPVVKIADTFNRVVFSSEGYTIGIGETLVKALKKL